MSTVTKKCFESLFTNVNANGATLSSHCSDNIRPVFLSFSHRLHMKQPAAGKRQRAQSGKPFAYGVYWFRVAGAGSKKPGAGKIARRPVDRCVFTCVIRGMIGVLEPGRPGNRRCVLRLLFCRFRLRLCGSFRFIPAPRLACPSAGRFVRQAACSPSPLSPRRRSPRSSHLPRK